MSNLIATFTQTKSTLATYVPLSSGRNARTEVIEIGSDSASVAYGTLEAGGSEDTLELYAEAACWYAIGSAKNPPDPTSDHRRFLAGGVEKQVSIQQGDMIACIEYVAG